MEYTNALVNSSQKYEFVKTCELYHSCTFIPFHFGSLLPSPLPVGQSVLPCPDGLLPHCLFRTDQWKDCTVGAAGVAHFYFVQYSSAGLSLGSVFPVSLDNGECIVQILLYNIVTSGSIGSQEVVELVAAVERCLLPADGSAGRQ